MTSLLKPTLHLTKVYETLIATYGLPQNDPDYDPLGGLIGTILSQHTSDINSGRAYRQLIDVYPTWEDRQLSSWWLCRSSLFLPFA